MKEFIKITSIAILGYTLVLIGKITPHVLAPFKQYAWVEENYSFIHYTTGNLIQITLCFLFTYLVLRFIIKSKVSVFSALGLSRNIGKGMLLGLAFTLPMFIGYVWQVGLQNDIKITTLITHAAYPGFSEELVYRAFFIGLLFRYTRLGFFPIVLIVSLIFGAGHLYQGESIMHSAMVMIVTSLGSMFFAWIYFEYKWNLWLPITMHTLMNLCWNVFALNTNDAAGNTVANTFRVFTILLAVFVTLYRLYKKGSALKGKLIWKSHTS
ncbi:CPBP family intramembrane glutamic endopeptidase [Carboxylicivirga sp. N1Y90]|uniref:CPBP family intramembrane glutamic endopeptidase n=1 Tax=Carboxylicivirga fragile TaxID=3417571 RepID=UPI003D353E09|nr:CPBP family intramembrane metalloprotease [Marinilabiliaceae bacterium N1Y90]